MSNFSYINAIPLPILDITNSDKTIRDLDVGISTAIKKYFDDLYGEGNPPDGNFSQYWLSNPETDTHGSFWPVGITLEELCHLYWNVGYMTWNGSLPSEGAGCSAYLYGGYMPAVYPRYSKSLTGDCIDYLPRGDLYYATRIINYNAITGNRENCEFYDGINNLYQPLRTFTANSKVDTSTCYSTADVIPEPYESNFGISIFFHPYGHLNSVNFGGSGKTEDLLSKFPCIVKSGDMYYPSISLGGFNNNGCESYNYYGMMINTFEFSFRYNTLAQCEEGSAGDPAILESYVNESKTIGFRILNSERSIPIFSSGYRHVECSCCPYLDTKYFIGNPETIFAHSET